MIPKTAAIDRVNFRRARAEDWENGPVIVYVNKPCFPLYTFKREITEAQLAFMAVREQLSTLHRAEVDALIDYYETMVETEADYENEILSSERKYISPCE